MERSHLIGLAQAERARLGRTIQYASPAIWGSPSLCEGWTNIDVMAHLAAQDTAAVQVVRGGEAEEFAAFRAANDDEFWVGGFNEWAVRIRGEQPAKQILEDWGRAADMFLSNVARVPDADWGSRRVPWVVGDIGIRYLVQSRVVEWWLHGEDIREAAELGGNPQHGPVYLVNDMAVRMLPWSLGRAGISLPGTTLNVELEGVGGGSWTWSLFPGETPKADRKPDAFIQGRATAFASIAGRRLPADAFLESGDLVLGGEEDVALAVLDNVRAFVD